MNVEVTFNLYRETSKEGFYAKSYVAGPGLILVVSAPFASAASLEEQLRKSYVGTQRMLRHCYDTDGLKFDSNGNPRNTDKEGPWTLLSGVIIDSLQLKPGKLELQGHRRMLLFDPSNKKLLKHRIETDLLD